MIEAEQELKFAEEDSAAIDPEVLIILPATVSVYIDMKKVVTEKEGDSLLVITLPPIEFDPVLIDLPTDSAVYKLDSRDSEWVTSQQGAYYDLFGQLKEAILQKEQEVRDKAVENGIVEEGQKMAREYLTNFVTPLGYVLRFEEAKPEVEFLPQAAAAKQVQE